MKRFVLFGGDNYYPGGGWNDYIGSFDSRKEAVQYGLSSKKDWWHSVDTIITEVIDSDFEYSISFIKNVEQPPRKRLEDLE